MHLTKYLWQAGWLRKHLWQAGWLVVCFFAGPAVLPVTAQPNNGVVLATPLTDANLDRAALAQWVEGAEKPILDRVGRTRGPEVLIWTTAGHVIYPELIYGDSKTPGRRHLRFGFKEPVLIGSVLAHGGGQLSVLKADAAYPGNLNDDSQWIPAQRLEGGKVTTDEVAGTRYAMWVLPQVVASRALRFTHQAQASDSIYGGDYRGAYVFSQRLANLSPQAVATAKSLTQYAGRLNDEMDNNWSPWNNIPYHGDRPRTIAEDPDWVMLTWPQPVTISDLASLGTGYSAAEVQVYAGPAGMHPSLASGADWKTIKRVSGWNSLYNSMLQVHLIDLASPVTTRAVRLRITGALDEKKVHPHLRDKILNGKRVWLDELMAFKALGSASLETAVLPVMDNETNHAPIAIQFSLPEDGFVTLVIEDSAGRRIRNLMADTAFAKGQHTVYWDGTDDLKRDLDAAHHGFYTIPPEFVPPGAYHARGLWHRQVDLNYELSVYAAGEPPWPTTDGSGGWMADHTPASCAVFIPATKAPGGEPLVGIGSYVSEGGAAFSWVNLDGKKIGGRGWIGGSWTGAQYLAGDSGPEAEPNVAVYVGSAFAVNKKNGAKGQIEIRLTKLTTLVARGDQPVLKESIRLDPVKREASAGGTAEDDSEKPVDYLGGLAVRNHLLVFSEPAFNKLVFIDAKQGEILEAALVRDPRAVAFDGQGRLLLLAGHDLLRYTLRPDELAQNLPEPETLVAGLAEPRGLTVDAAGKIYVSDQGNSHQVKVYSPDGQPLAVIGHPGAPQAGPYDPLHLNHPKGLAVDANGRIWVTEEYLQPKRVSVWNPDGTLWKAYYGPPGYGGGGALDAQDGSRFNYAGMEFQIDWNEGTSALRRVFYQADSAGLKLAFRSGPPETALSINGRHYLGNAFNSNATDGSSTAFLFLDRGDIAVPVAAAGCAYDWEVLKGDAFRSIWPPGINLRGDRWQNQAMFIWSDLNGDGQVQPEEIKMWAAGNRGVTIAKDGSFLVYDVNHSKEPGFAIRYQPVRFTGQGAPVYDPKGEILARAQTPVSDGGGQVLVGTEGWTVLTTAPPPFSNYGLGGAKDGVAMWSYPSLWPGLHPSHDAPPPDRPGELIGTTRLLGDLVTPRQGDAGPLFFINSNQGEVYVFTQDGLFVTQLFQDVRQGVLWDMPSAQRGMLLNHLTLHDENFFPSVTQIPDGSIYLDSGGLSALVKVNGLESIHRLAPIPVSVSAGDLRLALDFVAQGEAARQTAQGTGVLEVELQKEAPAMDGSPAGWTNAAWVPIDQRGVAAWFGANNPYDVQGAVIIAGGKLFALWKTGDAQLLRNSGEVANAPFKTGGGLDLMIGTDSAADPERTQPVAGDLRLIVTRVNGRTRALLYRAVVPNTPDDKRVAFSAPWHSIAFDSVTDVSHDVQLAMDGKGNYEIAIPLALLNLTPQVGQRIKGDIGILRGNGTQTTQRVYWNNKATAIVSDVPSEAMLTPNLWGIWEFRSP